MYEHDVYVRSVYAMKVSLLLEASPLHSCTKRKLSLRDVLYPLNFLNHDFSHIKVVKKNCFVLTSWCLITL